MFHVSLLWVLWAGLWLMAGRGLQKPSPTLRGLDMLVQRAWDGAKAKNGPWLQPATITEACMIKPWRLIEQQDSIFVLLREKINIIHQVESVYLNKTQACHCHYHSILERERSRTTTTTEVWNSNEVMKTKNLFKIASLCFNYRSSSSRSTLVVVVVKGLDVHVHFFLSFFLAK